MNGAKKTFLLPCAGCASDIDVVTGQAGGQLECPTCGTRNDVPKFRDLSQLRIKSQETAGRPRQWGLPQAVTLAGATCAALAWGTALWVGATPTAVIDASLIRANIDAGDDAALYRSLQESVQWTVDRFAGRGPTPAACPLRSGHVQSALRHRGLGCGCRSRRRRLHARLGKAKLKTA